LSKGEAIMRVFCLGGAGKICREAVFDLAAHSDFEEIAVGDFNEEEARRVAEQCGDPRARALRADVRDTDGTAALLKGYDVVIDGTQISMNGLSTECIAKAETNGVNLNGFGAEDEWAPLFLSAGKVCLPGFGMTPGVTQMMAMDAAAGMDCVREVYVSHGAFRPIAFSPSIAETTRVEYRPDYPGRVVYENGAFIQVPPFARPREVRLPEPYGRTIQYIIPHSETLTLAKALADKGVRLIEVRGTWPKRNMDLIRGLYGYGILENPEVRLGEASAGLMDIIGDYLLSSEAGRTTELYGYALHVEVRGETDGAPKGVVYTHTHPPSDGSVPKWAGLRAYTKIVGIPLAIAAILIAKGQILKDPETGQPRRGLLTPEEAFDPRTVFAELAKRGIEVHREELP
jgi:saccharopine dehydrogenase-like NADP-dependent oxidoreductase